MAVKRQRQRKAAARAAAPAPKPEDKALAVLPEFEERSLVDYWPHPITSEGRSHFLSLVPDAGASVHDVLAQAGLGPAGALAVRLDGEPVAREDWARRLVLPGQIVTARAVVQGGGDSNPFEVIATIAVLTLSLYLGGAPLATAALVSGATVIGGLVVNALFPVELPNAGEPGRAVFSLHGGSNQARPYEPAMLALGEHRVFPDLAAQEYTQFIGDDQFLFQLFDFGVGDLDIPEAEIKIGDTLLSSFSDVTKEKKLPGQAVTLLAGDVQTIAGAELPEPSATGYGDWIERPSGEKAKKLELDVVGLFFGRTKKGEPESRSVRIQIQRKERGTSWPPSPATTTVTLINSAAAPARKTIEVMLPDETKQWDIRARRSKAVNSRGNIVSRTTDQGVSWAALRTFQANTADATGRTRLALKIKASGQLQGRIERLSALVKQKVPTWNGTAWSSANQITSNPADIFRWFVKGVRADGRLIAGVGLPDTRIDETSIRAWRAWCDAEGLKCDAVLTGSQSIADVLNMICRCGRASASWASGKLGVVFDQAGLAPTAMITPGNIIAGTMEVNYADGRLADEIVVRYLDPDFDWQPAELRRLKAGVTAPSRTATVTLIGIVNREQAKEETNLIAARQKYHRRRITWEMGPEGLTIGRGDVVQVTSDLLSGGTTGRLQPGGTAASPVLNQAVNIKTGVNYMVLRLVDGTLHTTVAQHPDGATATGETTRPVLQTPLPGAPDNGGLAAAPVEKGVVAGDVLWRHYGATGPPRKLKIIEIEPRAMDRYRFTAIDEVTEYYDAAELELTDPLPDLRYRGPRVIACALSEKQIKVADGWANEITATLTVAGDWRGGVIRARRTTTPVDGSLVEPWRVVAVLDESQTSASWIDQPYGSLEIVVVPGSLVAPAGPSHTCAHTIVGDADAPDDPTNLRVLPIQGGWTALWDKPTEADYALTELRDAPQTTDNGDRADLRATIKGTAFSRMGLTEATSLRVFARHLDNSGNDSDWVWADVTTEAPAQDGAPGADGTSPAPSPGVQFIYRRTTSAISPTLPVGDSPADWTSTPSGVTSALKYEWVSQRASNNGVWGAWTAPVLHKQHGNWGRGAATYYKLDYDGTAWSDTAANELTVGDNVLTDVVVLANAASTPPFWEMRTWTGTAWLQINLVLPGNVFFPNSVTAREIFVEDLAALNLRVRNADIEGTIQANRIHSNVFNVRLLWGGADVSKQLSGSDIDAVTLTDSILNWDILMIWGQGFTGTNTQRAKYGSAFVPAKAMPSGSARADVNTIGAVRGAIVAGPDNRDVCEFSCWRDSADNKILRFMNRGSTGGKFTMIFGIKRPGVSSSGGGDGDAGTVPVAPARPTLAGGARQISVTITPVTNPGGTLHGYDLRRKLSSAADATANWTEQALSDGAVTGTITGLEDAKSYDVQVRARHSAGDSPWSDSASAWTNDAVAPSRPGRPAAPTVTGGSLRATVDWSPPSSNGGGRITHYRLRYKKGSDAWTTETEVAASLISDTISPLLASTEYQVQVQAKNSAGWGLWSSSGRGTTGAATVTVPGRPAAPTVTGGSLRVAVSWSAPSSDGGAAITHYRLRYKKGSDAWTTEDEVAASPTSDTISPLLASTEYQVQVSAKNSAGWGLWSPTGRGTTDSATPTPTTPLAAPSGLTVASGNRRLGTSWTAVTGAGQYQLRWKKTSASNWPSGSWQSNISRFITGLENGAEYNVQVRCRRNSADTPSPWSASVNGTPAVPVKYQGTLTIGERGAGATLYGYKPREGLVQQLGSIRRTAGTLTITRLTELRVHIANSSTVILTISGSPANNDSTFATLTVGSRSLPRTSASYSNGTWTWTASIGMQSAGRSAAVTLQ